MIDSLLILLFGTMSDYIHADGGAIIGWIVVSIILSAISSAIQQALAGEPEVERTRGLRANTRDPSIKLPILYGKLRIGGNDVFVEATGDDNKHLWVVQTLSEGECEGIDTAPEDDAEPGDSTEYDQLWLGDKLANEFGSNALYYFHGGTATQTVDSNLNAAISKFTDPMRYTCYIVWHLIYDYDLFQNLPQRNVLLKGRKLYDFRTYEIAWSDNPVLALYDFMTNDRYGYGFDATRIDVSSWSTAANYCDTKGWTINMRIDRDMAGKDVIDNICNLFRGQLVWYDGKFYLYYADLNYESTALALTDKNIVQNTEGLAELSIIEQSKFDYPDGLRISFIDAEKEYVEDAIVVGDNTGVIREITLDGCTSRQQASDMGIYILERMRLDRTIKGTFSDDALRLEPNDVVTLTNSDFGLSAQKMRVQSSAVRQDGLVELSLVYESDELYDDDYDVAIEEEYTCSLPDPYTTPPTVSNVSITEEQYYYRLRNFTRLVITFDEPANYPWYDHVEVWISRGGEDSTGAYEHQFNATDDFSIENVEEGEEYLIILRTVSLHGVKQDLDDGFKLRHVVLGYSDTPSSLNALVAVVNENSIILYSSKVNDADIELYEFRFGLSWNSSVFLAALRAPNYSLIGVKPGEHTFWANTLSNNGVYGGTPVSATVDLIDPPDGWAVQHTETCDYSESDDVHDNTEQTTYSGEDYLKCSHESGGLVGTYTSPIYDLGSSGRYLVYILADIVLLGVGNTWDDVVPDNSVESTTWNDISASTRTWNEIFELNEAAQVSMKLKYGDTSPPTNEVGKMEILSAIVTARYYQVEITITDPSEPINALVEHFTLKFCQ